MFIAIMHAAGDEWMAAGNTADEARESLTATVKARALAEEWNVETDAYNNPLEWFGAWVLEIEPGETYRDTTRFDRNGQYMPPRSAS